jgi:hypothetical protein
MPSVGFFNCYAYLHNAECHFTECRYAEDRFTDCHYAECPGSDNVEFMIMDR